MQTHEGAPSFRRISAPRPRRGTARDGAQVPVSLAGRLQHGLSGRLESLEDVACEYALLIAQLGMPE